MPRTTLIEFITDGTHVGTVAESRVDS